MNKRTIRIGADGFVTLELVGYDPLNADPKDRAFVEHIVSWLDWHDAAQPPQTPASTQSMPSELEGER